MNRENNVTSRDQNRALWLSTFAFTVCFAIWTIFSIIGIQIKKDLGLSDTQFGLLAATPILTGSLIRLFLGIWTEQYGGRIVFSLVMLAASVATWMLTTASTYPQFLLAALAVRLQSALPMFHNGFHRKSKVPRLVCSAPVISVPL